MTHTKEPWELRKGEDLEVYAGNELLMSDTCYYPMAFSEANASRIVACVNSCAGISTEQLERGKVGWLAMLPTHAEAVEKLTQATEQRDRLLEQLKVNDFMLANCLALCVNDDLRKQIESRMADTNAIIAEV